MIFNSVTFLLFLLVVVALYWVLPQRARLWMLFLSSLMFYGFWRVEYLSVMMLSAVTDYYASLRIYGTESKAQRKFWLGASLVINLGLLFYFKYLFFFANNAIGLANLLGIQADPITWNVLLPLGISFYTFQTISYTVDVYRGFIEPERDFVMYGCFVTFFPQLVAGPVLRASEVTPHLASRPPLRGEDIAVGLRRILYGLFLKVVLADNIAPFVNEGFGVPIPGLSALDVWTLAFLFGLQIYFDFSAYSHIAIGCARLMGITFPENFDFPYATASPRDFWKRWHISLSSWIRDYVYLPLAGVPVRDRSTGGLGSAAEGVQKKRTTRALFLTWAIMGLWHGANWTFVFWGLYHATFIFAYRLIARKTRNVPSWLRSIGGWSLTLPIAMLSWIPFRAANLSDTFQMYAKLFDPSAYRYLGLSSNTYAVAALLTTVMVLAYLVRTYTGPLIQKKSAFAFAAIESVGYGMAIALVFVFLRPISQFIYFQF